MKKQKFKLFKYPAALIFLSGIILFSYSTEAQVKETSQDSKTYDKQNSAVDNVFKMTELEELKKESKRKMELFNSIILSLNNEDNLREDILKLKEKIKEINDALLNYNPKNVEWREFKKKAEEELDYIENSLYTLTGNDK